MKRRGSSIVAALLLGLLLLVLGLALMTRQIAFYRSATQAELRTRTRALALAGLEDFRLKLERDSNFPPQPDPSQTQFSYTEVLRDGGNVVGTYTVRIDSTLAGNPWLLLQVHSTGRVGSADNGNQYSVNAEFDLSTTTRGLTTENPQIYLPVQIIDPGTP